MFRIKICGVTCLEDARVVAAAGADAIGLNFYSESVRRISVDVAQTICQHLPSPISRIGVFVNETASRIVELSRLLHLDFVQLHGDESVRDVFALEGLSVIRAVRASREEVDRVLALVDACRSERSPLAALLLDAVHPRAYGGTGKTADWQLFSDLRKRLAPLPLILAGGLRPDNVARAVAQTLPDAVDTASGVERRPGRKDPKLVQEFVARAQAAFAKLAEPPRNG